MELAGLITKFPDNFKAALEIKNALPSAAKEMMKKFLEAVIEMLKTWGYEHEKFDIEDRNHALQYRYDKLPDTVVCLGSGDYDTWVSYYFTGWDKAKPVDFLARLKEYRGVDCKAEYKDSFFGWESCRLSNGASPNFYPDNPNEAMIALCDDEKFNEFVKLCAEKIKAFLDFFAGELQVTMEDMISVCRGGLSRVVAFLV